MTEAYEAWFVGGPVDGIVYAIEKVPLVFELASYPGQDLMTFERDEDPIPGSWGKRYRYRFVYPQKKETNA